MTSTQNMTPVRRDDGELIGFLEPRGTGWVPCTVFGYPLATQCARVVAEEILYSHGLSYLGDRWELYHDGAWVTVSIIEASPSGITVRYIDYGHPDLFNARVTLTEVDPRRFRKQ